MDTSRLGPSCLQVLVVGLEGENIDVVINTYSMGHNVKITHATDAWSAGFQANECKPSLILIDSSIEGLDSKSIVTSLSNATGATPKIVAIGNMYQHGVNQHTHGADSKEVIKQAVQQLLTA